MGQVCASNVSKSWFGWANKYVKLLIVYLTCPPLHPLPAGTQWNVFITIYSLYRNVSILPNVAKARAWQFYEGNVVNSTQFHSRVLTLLVFCEFYNELFATEPRAGRLRKCCLAGVD